MQEMQIFPCDAQNGGMNLPLCFGDVVKGDAFNAIP